MRERERIDEELRRQLIVELCAIVDGYDQCEAAAMLQLRQPNISALRRGRGGGFSVARLIRIIAGAGYNVELHLRVIPRRFARPRKFPTVTVARYDVYGRQTKP